MDYSKSNVLIIDQGLGCSFAERLARDCANIRYWTPVYTSFPKIEDFAKGYGFKGVEKVTKPFKYIDDADLIVFPDLGYGDMADHLRKIGKTVFSAGDAGEELELERYKARQIQDRLGLPTQYTAKIKGIDKLEKYLTENKGVFVKPRFRGTRETTHITDEMSAEMLIKKLRARYGPMSEELDFVVEDEIRNSVIEYGMDVFHNGKDFIKPYLSSIEKGAPYLGHFREDLPPSLQNTMNKLNPLFQKINYRGAFSTEELLTSKKKSYLLDWTSRFGFPFTSLYTEAIKNFTEVIFSVARGEDVTIDPIAPWVGALPIQSEEGNHDWLYVERSKKATTNIKPLYGCEIKGKMFAVKGFETVANVIAWGDSPKSVVNWLKDLTKEVNGYDLAKETSKLDEILDDIKTLKEMGIDL